MNKILLIKRHVCFCGTVSSISILFEHVLKIILRDRKKTVMSISSHMN